MTINLVLFLLSMLAISLAVEPLAERLRLPFSTALVIVGFVGSEVVVGVGWDTGVRWELFDNLILFVLLPILIFEASLHIKIRELVSGLVPILFLAVPILLISTAICAFLLYWAIGDSIGFPWLAALFTGAILSATDPMAVLVLFKKMGAPKRLALLVDGESLFNDATAIVVAMLVITMATSANQVFSVGSAVSDFLIILFGGAIAGMIAGLAALVLMRIAAGGLQRTAVSLILAYGAYICCEVILNVSGVLAAMFAGLTISWNMQTHANENTKPVYIVWAQFAYLANSLVFLLLGVTITTSMFELQWLPMLYGIGAAIVARWLSVYLAVPVCGFFPGVEAVPAEYCPVMFWGGLRGAVTIALALSIPLEVEWWFTAQSIAYGVVLFSLFVQAPTMPAMLRHLKLVNHR